MKTRKCTLILIILLSIMVFFTSCSRKNQTAEEEAIQTITIAEQFGLAYAPVQIMRLQQLIEKENPKVAVNWVQLENTAAIREAIVAGRVDAGFGGIPPFLIGWDSGMEWKIAIGLSSAPLGLVTKREGIKTIEDFTEQDKIILPQPGSIQHILLSMALERSYGDSHLLDNNLLTMSHPNGMSAMLSDASVAAHFTSPPYLFMELEQPGFSLLLTGKEAMGEEFTFIVGSVTRDLHDNRKKSYDAFLGAVAKAVDFITENPREAAELLAPEYNLDTDLLYSYLTYPGMDFTTSINGVMTFADFMKKNGYLKKLPDGEQEVVWDTGF